MNGPIREDDKIEYNIRKYQRAISVAVKTPYSIQGMGGEEAKRDLILDYATRIIDLKKRLYELTGRHTPLSPKWPV